MVIKRVVYDRLNPHWVYDYERPGVSAESILEAAKATAQAEHRNHDYIIASTDEWYDVNRHIYLDQPLEEITEEKYEEMLNVLPPLNYCVRHGVAEFCMSEMTWGSFTTQCAYDSKTGKYYWKHVDSRDTSTWIDRILYGETHIDKMLDQANI